MTQTHTLPDKMVIPQKALDADAAIRKAVQDIQASFHGICTIQELLPYPTSIEDITGEWVRSRIEQKKELVKADLSLTSDERKSRLNAWQLVEARAIKFTNRIELAFQSFPNAHWLFEEKINNFWCTNIDEVITSLSTIQVPDECKEHYALICEAIEKVRQLREWEDAHNVISQPLAAYQDFEKQNFVEAWVSGAIKLNNQFNHLGIYPRNFKDPKNPNRVII